MKKFLVLVSSLALSVTLVTGCGETAKDTTADEEKEVFTAGEVEESIDVYEHIEMLREVFETNQAYYAAIEEFVEFIDDEEVLAALTDEEVKELGNTYRESAIDLREIIAEMEKYRYNHPDTIEKEEKILEMLNLEADMFEASFESVVNGNTEAKQKALAAVDQIKTLNEQLAEMFQKQE